MRQTGPHARERDAAQVVIERMRRADVTPPILANNAPADAAVVACSLALHFGHDFGSDRVAKHETFGVANTTDVRTRWIDGKIASLLAIQPGALNDVAPAFGVVSTDSAPAASRQSERLASRSNASAPAVASPAAADTVAQEADQEDQEGSREGAGGEQRSGGPETPEERDLRRARDTLGHIETVRQEVAKYQRRAHLQYYHPRCERLADGTPAYPPSQAAVNRDRTAAACLPLAGALIEELLLRLEEKNAAIRMAEADAEIADVRHEGAMIALTAEVMARRGSTSEYAPAAAASETQSQRAQSG